MPATWNNSQPPMAFFSIQRSWMGTVRWHPSAYAGLSNAHPLPDKLQRNTEQSRACATRVQIARRPRMQQSQRPKERHPPECWNACKKEASPSKFRSRVCSIAPSCRQPFARKCRTNCDIVVLAKKDRSKLSALLNNSFSSSSLRVAIVAATAQHDS